MIDTYWSDHCRHTTFSDPPSTAWRSIEPQVEQAAYERYLAAREEVYGDRKKPDPDLMDMATIGGQGAEESAGCLAEPGRERGDQRLLHQDRRGRGRQGRRTWLLMFKNETHNHPTEIEPFGGAATCIGGAIRDPLSGRSLCLPGHARHRRGGSR